MMVSCVLKSLLDILWKFFDLLSFRSKIILDTSSANRIRIRFSNDFGVKNAFSVRLGLTVSPDVGKQWSKYAQKQALIFKHIHLQLYYKLEFNIMKKFHCIIRSRLYKLAPDDSCYLFSEADVLYFQIFVYEKNDRKESEPLDEVMLDALLKGKYLWHCYNYYSQ